MYCAGHEEFFMANHGFYGIALDSKGCHQPGIESRMGSRFLDLVSCGCGWPECIIPESNGWGSHQVSGEVLSCE